MSIIGAPQTMGGAFIGGRCFHINPSRVGNNEQITTPLAAISVDDTFANRLRNSLTFHIVVVNNIGDVGLLFEPFFCGGLHFIEV